MHGFSPAEPDYNVCLLNPGLWLVVQNPTGFQLSFKSIRIRGSTQISPSVSVTRRVWQKLTPNSSYFLIPSYSEELKRTDHAHLPDSCRWYPRSSLICTEHVRPPETMKQQMSNQTEAIDREEHSPCKKW